MGEHAFMAPRLTVIIPCKDEEANIGQCLQSARQVADEVLVADSGSTDATLEIVRRSGPCRIIERAYVNSGDFKNWAIPQAQHDWVLIVDADERLPAALAAEIRQLLRQGPPCDGYWIYRANFFMGHRVRFSGWQSDRVLRLFRRDCGVYRGGTDHAEVDISTGRVGRLRHRLLHYSYWTYDEYFQRLQRYTSYQAHTWHAEGRRASAWKLATHLPLRFLHAYIGRLGFLDGLVGLQVCALTGYYSFLKQARLWQLQHGRTRDEIDRVFVPVDGDQACVPPRLVA
jgi:glycosyltransferase involved in cell wall biosynthesis